tara:strand:+ start:435 stop:689 length:255 start_codon:yes stop_codon:yes gene_type:complete
MAMMKKKTKGYRGGGKVKKMSKGGTMGGKVKKMSKGGATGGKMASKMNMGGVGMTMAQLRSAASAKGMTLSPMKAAKGGAAKKK